MLECHPLRSHSEKHAVSARHSPRQNHLLAALSPASFAHLLPALELVPLRLGSTVYGSDERENYLYFITEGIICRFGMLENGSSAEFAVTGNEGVIGIASFLGGKSTKNQAVVLITGYAYRLRTALLRSECEHGGPLLRLLLHYTQALITQTGQTAICNRHHSLEQRLCFWILSCLDRIPSKELAMTQEQIANMLGVRREGVTQAAGSLQTAGLIRYSRGHITLLDRPRLEARACECYAVVKREYDRLLGPKNNVG